MTQVGTGQSPVRPRPSAELKAWAALGANLLVLPGVGSLAAGRLAAGLAQAALALTGFGMTLVWLAHVFALMRAAGSFLLDPPPDLRLGLGGIGLFGAAWLWSAATGWAVVQRARRAASPESR